MTHHIGEEEGIKLQALSIAQTYWRTKLRQSFKQVHLNHCHCSYKECDHVCCGLHGKVVNLWAVQIVNDVTSNLYLPTIFTTLSKQFQPITFVFIIKTRINCP